MTPDSLLDQADQLLREVVPGTRGLWPRACAVLIRLAVESAVDEHWDVVDSDLRHISRRSQFLVLPQTVDADLARRTEVLWASLSRATHHQAYELAPTAGELRTWEQEARDVVERLTGRTAVGKQVSG